MSEERAAAGSILWSVVAPAVILVVLGGVVEALGHLNMLAPSIATPHQVAVELAMEPGLFWFHVEPTLMMAGTGFISALLLSLIAVLACFCWGWIEGTVVSLGAVMDSVPIIAIAPVLAIWLGLSLPMRLSLTVMICTFPILVSTLQGLRAVPQTANDLFSVLSVSRWQRFRLLALPYALPYLFVGLKVAAPLAVLGALMAETTGVERGLGSFIVDAMFGMRTAQLWAGVVLACLLSLSFYGLVTLFERLLVATAAP